MQKNSALALHHLIYPNITYHDMLQHNDLFSSRCQLRYMERLCQKIKGQKSRVRRSCNYKSTSRNADEFEQRNTVEKDATDRLVKEGKQLKAGQTLEYIVTGYERRKGLRSMLVELIDGRN